MPTKRSTQNVRQADEMDAQGRTLRRGLALMDTLLAAGTEGARVVDLCRATGLGRPTVYRLLEPLLAEGWVVQRERFLYVAGPKLARGSASRPNLAVRLQPLLAQISAGCGDAAFAIVQEGSLSSCIARQVGTHPLQVLAIQVGTQQPLGVGAAGLALLAALPDDEVSAIIAGNEPVLHRYGGMTPARLRTLVRATRERGWAVIGNHALSGVLAVGMPVLDARGRPVAAISVASTQLRMTRERQHQIAQLIRNTLSQYSGDAPLR